ncbi:hypothetical protein [Methylobacterium sp. Leaf85]|uniref:hypothetical protein n=1 Tax=Methylobacterium sp. Leaf85 TaxID=1736241 RepID=UPI000AF543C4|nr:hypothetical protein [Methylobacterium sp. Leaf85]
MLKSVFSTTAIIMSIYSSAALAQCDPRLFMSQDIDFSHSSKTFRLIYARDITQTIFEELKRSGKISTIIPDIDLPVDISFSDFKKLVYSLLDRSNLDVTQAQADTIYKSRLSQASAQMYAECLKSHQIYTELQVPENASSLKKFFAILTWHGPAEAKKGTIDIVGRDRFQILGGEIIDRESYNKIGEIKSGESIRIPVERDLNDDFSMSMSVDGHSAQVDLPKQAVSIPIQYVLKRSADVSAYGDSGNDQENQGCLNADSDEELLVSSANIVNTVTQKPSGGRIATFFVGPKTSKSICMAAKADVDGPGKVSRIIGHIEAIAIKSLKSK